MNNIENLIIYLNLLRRVTHICVGYLTIIGSDNGLSPRRHQAIIWTYAGISLIAPNSPIVGSDNGDNNNDNDDSDDDDDNENENDACIIMIMMIVIITKLVMMMMMVRMMILPLVIWCDVYQVLF